MPPTPGATPAPDPAGPSPEGPAFDIVRVDARLQEKAAARLVAFSSTDRTAGRRFLDAAKTHAIDLTHFWASVSRSKGAVREACLLVPGSGQTAMAFLSNPAAPDSQRELGAVADRACRSLEGFRLAQALVEPAETGAQAALLSAGFTRLDELLYLRRPRPAPAEFDPAAEAARLPDAVTLTTWSPGDDAALESALEASYIDTLDCPELCGLRPLTDVIASHRATGQWDPRLWWIVREHGTPRGAVLFNPCPDQSSIELVYLGLGPTLRGRGLASALLRIGLSALARREEAAVTCAVDARNTPARRLYERAGFVEFGRRVALVRALR